MEKLKERIIENGTDYVLVGDYYIPDLGLEEDERPIGKWGRIHRKYLKEKHPAVYSSLLLSGKLWSYLDDLDKQAVERLEIIMEQMKQAEGVNEELKARDQMKWIQMIYSIQNRAEEIVRNELSYCI